MESAFTLTRIGYIDVALFLHTTVDPPKSEWDRACEKLGALAQARGFVEFRALVVSDGGAPNAAQRSDYFGLFDQPIQSSLLSIALNNPFKRALGQVVGWMNPGFRMFPPSEAARAIAHLNLTEALPILGREYQALQQQLAPVETLRLVSSIFGWKS